MPRQTFQKRKPDFAQLVQQLKSGFLNTILFFSSRLTYSMLLLSHARIPRSSKFIRTPFPISFLTRIPRYIFIFNVIHRETVFLFLLFTFFTWLLICIVSMPVLERSQDCVLPLQKGYYFFFVSREIDGNVRNMLIETIGCANVCGDSRNRIFGSMECAIGREVDGIEEFGWSKQGLSLSLSLSLRN